MTKNNLGQELSKEQIEYFKNNEDLEGHQDDNTYYFYRGYDKRYSPLNSKDSNLYTWVTDDFEYAKEYANDIGKNGRIAKIEVYLEPEDIGNVNEIIPDHLDYLDLGDENFKKYVLDKGLLAYQFDVTNNYSGDSSWCLCVKKDCCKVVDKDVKAMESLTPTINEDLSPEQQEYFKDSKVRDKDGNLLVCYHGTPQKGFKEFDARKGNSQFGKYKFKNANVNYFTTNKASAVSYTDIGYENDGNVYACYVNIVNPYVVNSETEVDINTSFNIKDKRLRERQIELFDKLIDKYEWESIEDLDLEEFNEDLLTLNLEARIEDEYLVIYELGKNSMFGAERPVYSQYTDEDLFDNFYDVEDFQEDLIGEVDDYYFSTDDVVRYVLSLDEDYDGIIIEDIFDSKSPFSGTGTDVITLRSSNQIKEISNLNPTSSNRIDEELKQEELQKIIDVINKYSKVKITTDSIKEVNKEDDGSYYINFYSSKGNDIQPEIPYEGEDANKYNEMLNELASLGYKKPIRTNWLRVYGPHGHNKAIWWIQLKPKTKIELEESKADQQAFIDKFGQDQFDLFLKSKDRLKNANISTDIVYHTKNTSVEDMKNILNNLRAKVNRTSKDKEVDLTKIPGEYKYLGSKGGYDVYQPLDVESSMALGVGTGWCTTGRYGHYGDVNFKPSFADAEKHWKDYTSNDIEFYYFLQDGLGKYALALYPEVLGVDKFINENIYVQKANFEIYDAEDKLDYKATDLLPLNLIPKKLVLGKVDVKNGLFIKNGVLKHAYRNIETAIIPNGVKSIEEYAFNKCTSLKSVTIPNSVKNIGNDAFDGCTSLTSITIPNGVKSIDSVFCGCTSLKNIIIPASITSIGFGTFANCTSLTSITIPNGVKSIGSTVFSGCTSLASITIPDSVTRIGYYAFSKCTSLKSITIPNSVKNIEGNAFSNCTSLASVIIPNGVKSIDRYAFFNCSSLTNIVIPESVETIESEAFSDCESLKSIAIPNSVKSMGGHVFLNCPDLTVYTNNKYVIDYCKENKVKHRILKESLTRERLDEEDTQGKETIAYRSNILYRVEKDEYNPSGKFYATSKEDAEQYGNNVKEYKLKSDANLYSGTNSEYYCIENNLEDVKFDILQKTFGIDKLNDMYKKFSVNGEDVEGYTFHDNDRYIPNDLAEKTMEGLWAYQLVAKEDLSNKGYDGAFWKYEDGTIDKQYQIWNQDVVEEISLKESLDWNSMEEVDNEEYNEKSTIKDILDILYGVNSLEEIKLYHGTTKDNWTKIKEEGMLKAQELYGPNTKIGDKGVYLTTSKDDAKEYVSRMHEEDAIVLEIEVNKLDFDKLYVDLNEIYRVMIDEDGKEYWDIYDFVYLDNIPLDAVKNNNLTESKADSEGKLYYRFSLEDAFGDNKGGIFGSSAMWDLIYSVDEDDQDDVDRANMLEEILDSLMQDHKVPNEWYHGSKFAFSKKFVEEHKEDFETIRDILDFWDYVLIIDKINKDEVEVTYEDEDQIAYKLKEELTESKADLEKFRQWAGDELADRFYKQKDRLEGKEKDIYYWMSRGEAGKQELLMTLRDYEKMPTRKEVDQKGKEGAVKVYEDDEWKVYHITSYEGAVKYGKGTRWCISASKSYEGGMLGRDFWDGYSDSEIYFYINKKNDSKYALVYDSEDHWTIYDDADYVEVGNYIDYANDEDSWNPYDASKPHFPDVKGLPDINAEYDRAEREIKALYPKDELDESLNNYNIPVYRVDSRQGEGNDEWKNDIRFFADSLEYYDHSDTRYDKNKAKKYLLNVKDFKVFDPMVEWKDNLDVESWSVIRTTEEFCDEKGLQIADYLDGVDYDNPNEYHEVLIDTDSLAAYGLDNGYDITIIRDIPQYYVNSYGEHDYSDRDRKYTEYAVHNSKAVKLANAKKFDKGSSKVDEELSSDMSEEEIKALVDKYFTEENLNKVLPQLEAKEGFYGKCFIDAKGKVYDVQKLANAHDSFLMDVFDDCYRTAEGKYPNWDDLEEIEDKYDIGAIIVDAIWDKLYNMNWIQCSNEIGGYIALRGRTITEDQFNAMETWISNLYEHGGESVEISLYTPTGWKSKRYLLKDNLPEDIIKKIRRASKSGYLPEELINESIKKLELESGGARDGIVFYTTSAKEALDKMKQLEFTRFVYLPIEGMYVISDDYIHTDLQDISLSELGCDSSQMVYDFIFSTGNHLEGEMEEDEGDIYTYKDFEIFDRYEGFKETSLYEYLGEPLNKRHIKHTYWESINEDYGYHAGDLGKSEYYGRQSGGRNTGHFGTGTYFVGNPEKIKNYNKRDEENAPQHKVDFSKYHLYKPSNNDIAYDLHDTLGLLDGVYTWYLPILKEITNVVKQSETYIYDGQPIQNLSEFIDDLNKCEEYYDVEPIDKERALRYLDEEEFDKYLDEIGPDEWDNAWEEKYALEKVFNDKLKRYKNWRISTDVNKINNIVEELYKALEGKHTKEEIQNALNKVVEVSKEYKTRNADREDSLATVFMKALGYEGVDTRHLNKDENGTAGLDNTSYGSVIYDLKPDTVVECLDEELLSTEEFDMFVAESPYQAKNYLLGQVEAQRIFADETSSTLYLIAPTYETIHSDMTAFARECGYNTKMDDFDKKKACLIFVPNTDDFFDEEGDAFDDDYTYRYIFNGGEFIVYSRYQDFKNFDLCKAFGNDYIKEERVDYDSDAYREGILFEKISPKFNLQSFLKERLENYKVEGNKTITTKISR